MAFENFMYQDFIDLIVKGRLSSISIPNDYQKQVKLAKELLKNDQTGLIGPILDFKINAGAVDFNFQTKNDTLRKLLFDWKKQVNTGIGIDVPRGLKELTVQYLKERWTSSFIVLRISWGNLNGFIVPKKVWLVDGSSVKVEGNGSVLGKYKYFVDGKELKNTPTETVIIRKPYNSWYDKYPSVYLVKNGALYNGMVKRQIVQKWGDLMEAILPYMLAVKAGSDAALRLQQLPTEAEMSELVDSVKQIQDDYNKRIKRGLVGGFSYDVNFEHIIPDLTKFINKEIVRPIDNNILSSLGMIELQGFSSNRQEAILNPKVLVEEVKDAIADLAIIYEDIVLEMIDKNSKSRRNLMKNDIEVVPGTAKAFTTNDMLVLLRGKYDRGGASKKSYVEDDVNLKYDIEVTQRDIERKKGDDKNMFPPVIMNQDNGTEPDAQSPEQTKENSPEKKKTEKDVETADIYCEFCNGYLTASEIPNLEIPRCPVCENLLDITVPNKEDSTKHKTRKYKKRKKKDSKVEE